MAGWLGRLQAQGLDPDLVIPEPLLVGPPEEGFVRYDRGAVPLYRGASDAFSVEPDLAALVVGDAAVETIDDSRFETGPADAIATPPVNISQAALANRPTWQVQLPPVPRS